MAALGGSDSMVEVLPQEVMSRVHWVPNVGADSQSSKALVRVVLKILDSSNGVVIAPESEAKPKISIILL